MIHRCNTYTIACEFILCSFAYPLVLVFPNKLTTVILPLLTVDHDSDFPCVFGWLTKIHIHNRFTICVAYYFGFAISITPYFLNILITDILESKTFRWRELAYSVPTPLLVYETSVLHSELGDGEHIVFRYCTEGVAYSVRSRTVLLVSIVEFHSFVSVLFSEFLTLFCPFGSQDVWLGNLWHSVLVSVCHAV